MDANIVFIHALTPLHAGIGQGTGVIDLPIAREKATRLPFFPGSSIKGALRTQCTDKKHARIFGGDPSDATDNRASSVLFSDQRLLLFPVRSLAGTFAWVTSPYILRRLQRDLIDAGITSLPDVFPLVTGTNCVITPDSKLAIEVDEKKLISIEDLDLPVSTDSAKALEKWAEWLGKQIFPGKHDTFWQQMLREKICLVPDDVFRFLAEQATQIATRIRLEEHSKTVQQGGLWYEEMLPTETILSGMVMISPTTDKDAPRLSVNEILTILNGLCQNMLQLGGMATVGRGFCHVHLLNKEVR
ncbi:type III-B CRISPR module RAMP protein Cmr4 [Tengunoibacter tsumagoiensis]|uniref:Type III-B CRISPR module RAMP protein Cmr4 n=1 Tax=Tengunoibacter tsumagoiensis TaxID=2014871 RepID=A0A402A6A5_9CHLR|nr:type III-B CRISPR module RAMP protein Cmr4 [Tengunoibacter tsumagoiensis]GCE14566.1 type III-B CRISPR module RAMP protein Cmr4 [Tengunoibacter tsumagoiensis]